MRILERRVVKPRGEQAHEGALGITTWDQLFGLMYNRTVLLYERSPGTTKRVVEALGRALAQFSPLAGRFRWAENGRRRGLDIVCNGEGAEVAVVQCDEAMSSFQGPEDHGRATLLLPEVDYTRPLEELPLLLLQITMFRCGGVALGISMAHTAADGEAAFHFFSEWARLSRGESLKEAPSHSYRKILRERESSNDGRRQQLKFSDHLELQDLPSLISLDAEGGSYVHEWDKEMTRLELPLSKTQVDALKKATYSPHNGDATSKPFTRFEVISAHIWRCLCKARQHEFEQETVLGFPMNVRKRIHNILLPSAIFGNMAIRMRAKSRAGELISNGLEFACGMLREAIDNVDEEYIWSNFELLENQDDLTAFTRDLTKVPEARNYNGNPNMRVTSWFSLPMQDLDFGWGNTIKIIPLLNAVDGTALLLPGYENDGSVTVIMCIQVHHVDEFKKQFYEDTN